MAIAIAWLVMMLVWAGLAVGHGQSISTPHSLAYTVANIIIAFGNLGCAYAAVLKAWGH